MKAKGKRSAPPPSQQPSKKRKVTTSLQPLPKKRLADAPRKEKFADRGIIPIPVHENEEDTELSDKDIDVLNEYGNSISFLDKLDRNGILRSKKETQRLHEAEKPVRRKVAEDELPPLDTDDDAESWSSGIDELSDFSEKVLDSDAEMPYESAPRKPSSAWEREEQSQIQRLPIKLADGKIKEIGTKPVKSKARELVEEGSSDEERDESPEITRVEHVSTGARFGRASVADVLNTKSRKAKVELAKEQIAGICQEILADPENSLGLLRRLHSFSLKEISAPGLTEPIPNDLIIRKLAVLSQLTIFKDIIPGYRIRALTDKEKAEKVSQMVSQTREWEQGLVGVYQSYLRALEIELKAQSGLSEVALHCMCTLLTEVTHFNFRVNLMTCVVTRLSRKSWDKSSDRCLDSVNQVLKADLTGEASLEMVRLLNRMVKERRFKIHPRVLSCLHQLRLRTELGVRASDSAADKAKDKPNSGTKKPEKPHLSKKAKKALKEKKEINKELREAEAEVDKAERASRQTETLKLLFALYFRILKNPRPSPLLPAALSGISKFAHLVNIDFFKDLLKVLKDLIALESDQFEDSDNEAAQPTSGGLDGVHHRLLCIVAAFELLSGQGEALNIDLSDFISHLYALILSLSLVPNIDSKVDISPSTEELLFRALNIIFSPRTSGAAAPSWRSAAFAKRLLTAAVHWPPSTALRAIEFVAGLVAKDSKLAALLSSEDRIFNGVYHPEIDDPQLCNAFGSSFWELHALHENYWDARVREEARKLLSITL
ncbi:hypothetical protein K443DRAFT_672195 [Laccaria amethystina LaAM-08-1]|uniref:Nucleolar complex-associated protein 3 n=1 Tax=Laccaria amethystina LaAM-08-1 TaxID=1095629 RepID=A0A0C9YKR0_9AGAR|nr:hypothetical protein K443DRAFT_672195 [Laccaria amethystina LaAM-08-1]